MTTTFNRTLAQEFLRELLEDWETGIEDGTHQEIAERLQQLRDLVNARSDDNNALDLALNALDAALTRHKTFATVTMERDGVTAAWLSVQIARAAVAS